MWPTIAARTTAPPAKPIADGVSPNASQTHTGDIGRLDPDGYLTITDRKKELLKTSGGKFVAPQPIENLLRSDRYVQQAVVIGDGRRFVAALIVPAFDQLAHYARARGIPFLAFRGPLAGASTGAHVHVGAASPRLN